MFIFGYDRLRGLGVVAGQISATELAALTSNMFIFGYDRLRGLGVVAGQSSLSCIK